jgi:hypothetical protein
VSEALITLPHLRTLIGLRVRHQGEICVVVEVLESPPTLVLEMRAASAMQADMHGRPWEYGREHRMVPVLSEDGTALHDALLDLDILD